MTMPIKMSSASRKVEPNWNCNYKADAKNKVHGIQYKILVIHGLWYYIFRNINELNRIRDIKNLY